MEVPIYSFSPGGRISILKTAGKSAKLLSEDLNLGHPASLPTGQPKERVTW